MGTSEVKRGRGRFALLAGVLVIGGAFAAMQVGREYTYVSTPGLGARSTEWPPGLARGDGPVTVVFVHPDCPCTGATLEAVDQIATRVGRRMRWLLIVRTDPRQPDRFVADGLHGSRLHRLGAQPGFELHRDATGELFDAFGVRTSGQVLVFAGDEREARFAGGLTPIRGHLGVTEGWHAIERVARSDTAVADDVPSAIGPVYGCSCCEETGG